jgi:hypothetical protein
VAKIENLSDADFASIDQDIRSRFRSCQCLEEAAQAFANSLYEHFSESIVLVRVFATMGIEQLPGGAQDKLRKTIESLNLKEKTAEQASVLCLLGTRGENSKWNDRRNSIAHQFIPLVTQEFVENIPMIARLLFDLGLAIKSGGSGKLVHATGIISSMNHLFYVADARTAEDRKRRKIISDVEFVEKYQVRTVFAFGGKYLTLGNFLTVIIFARHLIPEVEARGFLFLSSIAKAASSRMLSGIPIFAENG